MPDNIGLIAALVIPVVVLTVLRINAVIVFLSLCLGAVLVQLVAEDAGIMLNLFSSRPAGQISTTTLQLGLLLLPAVLTSVFTIFSVKGHGRVLLNILSAAGAAFLGVVLAVPLLAPGLRFAIQEQSVWHTITRAQAMVVGVSAIISILFLWMQRRGKAGGEHKGR